MKKIIPLAVSIVLLLTACGQKANDQITTAPPPTIAVQEETQPLQPFTGSALAEQPPATASTAVQEHAQERNAPQSESASQITHDPEPAPEPAALADRQAAITVANAYAVMQYGVTTDASLTLDNSAYRFPAAVSVDASRETLEAKARDMVDFTFHQLMMQAGVDSIADAGFRCNVCIVEDGSSLLIYVLYDG